jgi:3-deoxy-D-arabino-heptulosonate 7-phosphate (DAHP) synthase
MKPYKRSKQKEASLIQMNTSEELLSDFDISPSGEELEEIYLRMTQDIMSDIQHLNCDIKYANMCTCTNNCCLDEETWDSDKIGGIIMRTEAKFAALAYPN